MKLAPIIRIFLVHLFCLVIAVLFSVNNLAFDENKIEQTKSNFSKTNYWGEEEKIFDLINKERRKYRLGDLDWNSELADLARSYSKKMARENFFSHFDKNGDSVTERARSMKISKWKKIGENLFMCEGYERYVQVAVKGWMESSSHRRNILDSSYNETGIGVARAKDGTVYVTQVFLQY